MFHSYSNHITFLYFHIPPIVFWSSGSLQPWGDSLTGGSLPASVSSLSSVSVRAVVGSHSAFAALVDGKVVTWGSPHAGGDSHLANCVGNVGHLGDWSDWRYFLGKIWLLWGHKLGITIFLWGMKIQRKQLLLEHAGVNKRILGFWPTADGKVM